MQPERLLAAIENCRVDQSVGFGRGSDVALLPRLRKVERCWRLLCVIVSGREGVERQCAKKRRGQGTNGGAVARLVAEIPAGAVPSFEGGALIPS